MPYRFVLPNRLIRTVLVVLSLLAAGFVAIQLQSSRAAAESGLTVQVSEAASVYSSEPGTNFGPGAWVGMDASPQTYAFYKFRVNIPDGTSVTGATFRCFAGSSSSYGAQLWSAGNEWSQNTLTWNNAPIPDFDSAPAGETDPPRQGEWTEADVTSAITTSGDYTFVGRTDSAVRWSCGGTENANPAQLSIQLVPSGETSSAPPTSAPPSSSTPPSSSVPASSTPASSTPATSSPAPSSSPPSSGGHKVLVIVGENHSAAQALALPHMAGWASKYGLASNYTAIRHPSLPNYLAIFGGSTYGITTDCGVGASGCVPTGQSVWDQTLAAGKSAKAYQESMQSNCQTSGSSGYAPRHGPWPYWTGSTERSNCKANDVPSGTTSGGNLLSDVHAGTLPTTGELTPNLCNDAHDCSLSTFDNWLAGWVPVLQAGPDYQAGRLTIVITIDEDDGSLSNRVPLIVIDPRLHGTTVTGSYNHYSLTRWLDENAGVSLLNNAASAPDLKSAFGL